MLPTNGGTTSLNWRHGTFLAQWRALIITTFSIQRTWFVFHSFATRWRLNPVVGFPTFKSIFTHQLPSPGTSCHFPVDPSFPWNICHEDKKFSIWVALEHLARLYMSHPRQRPHAPPSHYHSSFHPYLLCITGLNFEINFDAFAVRVTSCIINLSYLSLSSWE